MSYQDKIPKIIDTEKLYITGQSRSDKCPVISILIAGKNATYEKIDSAMKEISSELDEYIKENNSKFYLLVRKKDYTKVDGAWHACAWARDHGVEYETFEPGFSDKAMIERSWNVPKHYLLMLGKDYTFQKKVKDRWGNDGIIRKVK